MGPVRRLRNRPDVPDAWTTGKKRLTRPRRLHDGEGVAQTGGALRGSVVRQAEQLVLGLVPSRPQPQLQSPIGQQVDSGRLLRQPKGMEQIVVDHQVSDS